MIGVWHIPGYLENAGLSMAPHFLLAYHPMPAPLPASFGVVASVFLSMTYFLWASTVEDFRTRRPERWFNILGLQFAEPSGAPTQSLETYHMG
jgi:hypothetical protein